MSCNVVLTGHLGADAEIRDAGQAKVVELRMASTSRQKVGGEWTKQTNWFRVSLFGNRENLVQYLTKGAQVVVRGSLFVREFEKDGAKRYSLDVRADDVELVGGKSEGASAGKSAAHPRPAPGGASFDDDTDMPF